MRRIVLNFGLIAGAILSAMMLATQPFIDRIGFEKGELIGYSAMVLAFLMVYFGTRAYRDQVAGGSIGFGRALVVGLLITAVASLCYVATWELIYYWLAPGFTDKYAAYELDRARQAGASAAQIAAKARELAEFKTLYDQPLVNMALTFLEPLPVGFLATLVSAGLLSRKRREIGGLPRRAS